MGEKFSVIFGIKGNISSYKETYDRLRGDGEILFEKDQITLVGKRRVSENTPAYVYVVLIVITLFFLVGGILIGIIPVIMLYRFMIYRLPKEIHSLVIPISSIKKITISSSGYYLFKGKKSYVTILFTPQGKDVTYQTKINFSFWKKLPENSKLITILDDLKDTFK